MRIGSVCSCLVFVFFCLPLVSSCNAAPKIPAVVSVDMQRLMTESEPAKQASEHLGEVRAVLQKGFDDARRDNSASSGMITSTKTELQIPQ